MNCTNSISHKNIFILYAAFLVLFSTHSFAQTSSSTNKLEEFVVNITAANNPNDIVEVKFAYAFGDSLNYPELKFKMVKTPYVKKYIAKSFEGLIQSVNKNTDVKVSVGISVNDVMGASSIATGRIMRVFRTPNSFGVTTF